MSFVGRFVLFRSVLYRISEVSLYVPDNHAKLCFLFYTLKLWFSFFLDTTITLGHKFAFSVHEGTMLGMGLSAGLTPGGGTN